MRIRPRARLAELVQHAVAREGGALGLLARHARLLRRQRDRRRGPAAGAARCTACHVEAVVAERPSAMQLANVRAGMPSASHEMAEGPYEGACRHH